MSGLLPPKAVSPLIRAARWTMFLSGLAYGHYHLKSLTNREIPLLEREHKIREEKKAKRLLEKAREDREELVALGEAVGMSHADIELNFFGKPKVDKHAEKAHH